MSRYHVMILVALGGLQASALSAHADTGCDNVGGSNGRIVQMDQGSGFACQYGQNSYGPTNADATSSLLNNEFGYSSVSGLSSNDLNNDLSGYTPLPFQSVTYSGSCPAAGGSYCASTTSYVAPLVDSATGLYENTQGYYANADDPSGSVGGQFYTTGQLAASGLSPSYDAALIAAPVSDGGYGGVVPGSTNSGSSGSGSAGSGSSGGSSSTSSDPSATAPDLSALTSSTDFSTVGEALLTAGALGIGMLLAWVAVKYVRRVTGRA